ncbi:hypothetical protein Rsub_09188 [Raphidocelis subcapitata]|uniref:HPP transmembrane region domain-containing protein n=1 Tax=Raphidocelis subcapitata TaxID=307507 RepID=A0A2V0PA00_9CHLO|nr:hypothetical protein Rsub_09188 [Raphidocelis subcapitata]|eukprot:GBF96389.1 hypothetical protein Rsub_09188 [Raphidocelis subcapitata]
MAAALAVMMLLDAVHPPGGALVLLAMDSAAVQGLGWPFVVYPSLALTLLVALPIAAATNALKRRCAFDWPRRRAEGAAAGGGCDGGAAERWRAALVSPPGAAPGKGGKGRRIL